MTVEDKSSGKVIKTIGESNDRIDSIHNSFRSSYGLAFREKSVAVPESIGWDGKDDGGLIVPDGPYTLSLVAWDDNGNYNLNYQSCMTVVVDSKKPEVSVGPLEPSKILSPDGDGSKDALAFRNTGTVESGWKAEISDAAGTIVRTEEYKERSAPRDFSWDGTADSGKPVPDGTYSIRLSAKDEAGNKVVGEVGSIVVDTSRPAVSIETDESVMSPNGDGVRDSLRILDSVESFKGLETWKVFVLDPSRKEWAVAGGAGLKPREKLQVLRLFPRRRSACRWAV